MEDVEAGDEVAENGMFRVKVRGGCEGDEESMNGRGV